MSAYVRCRFAQAAGQKRKAEAVSLNALWNIKKYTNPNKKKEERFSLIHLLSQLYYSLSRYTWKTYDYLFPCSVLHVLLLIIALNLFIIVLYRRPLQRRGL